MYLITTVGELIRCYTVDLSSASPPMPNGPDPTLYQITDLGCKLTNNNIVLFMPDYKFIASLFASAHKPRASVALSKAYVHYSFYKNSHAEVLCQAIQHGLEENDLEKAKPFLILFQHMMEAAENGCVNYRRIVPQLLDIFFAQTMLMNRNYFIMMEILIDWVIKVSLRIPFVNAWMAANQKSWHYIFDWLKQNVQPPCFNDRNNPVEMTKPTTRLSNKIQMRDSSQYKFRN